MTIMLLKEVADGLNLSPLKPKYIGPGGAFGMYNVIFLDMDGVLCTPRACVAVGNTATVFSYLDPIGCLLLKQLCEEFDAKLVISSSWRLGHTDRWNFGQILNANCPNLGEYLFPDNTHWKTPDWVENAGPDNRRGSEIQAWIKINDLRMRNFVILDDDSDISPYEDHFAKCDVYDGLTWKAWQQAKRIMGG